MDNQKWESSLGVGQAWVGDPSEQVHTRSKKAKKTGFVPKLHFSKEILFFWIFDKFLQLLCPRKRKKLRAKKHISLA